MGEGEWMSGAAAVLEVIEDEAALIDAEGRIRWVNSAWRKAAAVGVPASVPASALPGAPAETPAESLEGGRFIEDHLSRIAAGGGRDGSGGDTSPDRDLERAQTLLDDVLASRLAHAELQLTVNRGGERRSLRVRFARMSDVVLVLQRDLTAEESLRQAVLDSDRRLQAAIDILPQGLWICDEHGRVVLQNEISRGRWDDLVGVRVDEAPVPEEVRADWHHAVRRALEGKLVRVAPQYPVGGDQRVFDHLVAPLRVGSRVVGVVSVKTDVTERLRTENQLRERNEAERLLFRELDHRVRNNLTALLALLDLSSRRARSVEELAASIRTRLQTMATVHSLLSTTHWTAVPLTRLLRAVAGLELSGRVTITGDAASIPPRQVTALGMVFNELLHNSQKHGALGVEGGHVLVHVTRDTELNHGTRVEITWKEVGGPPIDTVPVTGSGTELMVGLLRSELRGDLQFGYPREGASHHITIGLDLPYPSVQQRGPGHDPERAPFRAGERERERSVPPRKRETTAHAPRATGTTASGTAGDRLGGGYHEFESGAGV